MRTRRSTGRRRLATGAVALVAAILATGAVVATYTPLFAADEIRIVGTEIPRRELLAIAGVGRRSNVFHLDSTEVERRLERDPRILEATVTTALPSALTIAVTPRAPVAIAGEPASLVGRDGVVIGPAIRSDDRLPELFGGDVRTAAATAAAMSAALRDAVEAIVVRPDGGIGVRLEAGFSADFGDPSELRAKAASLAAVLEWATDHDVRVLSADLTVPGSPTAQLEEGETAVPAAG